MISSFILLLIFILFLYCLYKRKKLVDSLPPGPISLPIFGNLFQIDRTDPRRTFYKWYKKYGPLYTVWLGMDPHVMVCTKKLMQETFVKRGDEFSERPFYWTFDFFTHGPFGILYNYGQPWKIQRTFADRIFKNIHANKNAIEKTISNETEKLVKILQKKLTSTKSGVLNLKSDFERCVAETASITLTGRSLISEETRYRALLENIEKTGKLFRSLKLYLLNKFFVLRFVPLFNHFGFDEMCSLNSDYLDMMLAELEDSKKRFKNDVKVDEATDLMSAYLAELRDRNIDDDERAQWNPFNEMSEWHLICILSDVWPMAIQPTLATLQWAMLYMIVYPEVQQKIQKEIDAVVGSQRQPNSADSSKMPYASATVYEIQRCANVFPVNVPHSVAVETDLGGYRIPAKMAVVPQIAIVHMDEEVYENPAEFRPERFLTPDGKMLRSDDVDLPMAFSLGPRNCLGRDLVRAQTFLILVSLLQRFSFTPNENQPKPSLKPKRDFVMEPQPYDLITKLRNS